MKRSASLEQAARSRLDRLNGTLSHIDHDVAEAFAQRLRGVLAERGVPVAATHLPRSAWGKLLPAELVPALVVVQTKPTRQQEAGSGALWIQQDRGFGSDSGIRLEYVNDGRWADLPSDLLENLERVHGLTPTFAFHEIPPLDYREDRALEIPGRVAGGAIAVAEGQAIGKSDSFGWTKIPADQWSEQGKRNLEVRGKLADRRATEDVDGNRRTVRLEVQMQSASVTSLDTYLANAWERQLNKMVPFVGVCTSATVGADIYCAEFVSAVI